HFAPPANRAAAERERKVGGGRTLPFPPFEEKRGQESSSPRRESSPDLGERAARFRFEQVREERLRQDKVRFAAGDRQSGGYGSALEAKPRVRPVLLSAPANRPSMDVDSDIPAARSQPLCEMGRHRAGTASQVENEVVGSNEAERLDLIRHFLGGAFEEMY